MLTSIQPLHSDMQGQVEYFASAVAAGGDKREAMYRAARRDRQSPDAALRLALLQSLPNHSGYSADKARKALQAYATRAPSTENAALARLRLAEMRTEAECAANAQTLQQRLDKIVDIERTLDNDGHGTKPDTAR